MADINLGYVIYAIVFLVGVFIAIIIWTSIPSSKKVVCGVCKTKMKPSNWYVRKEEGKTFYAQKFTCRNKKCKTQIVWKEPLLPATTNE